MREEARKAGKPIRYNGLWRDRDPKEAPPGVKPVIRIKAAQTGSTTVRDHVQGEVTVANDQLDDMVLLRADGTTERALAVFEVRKGSAPAVVSEAPASFGAAPVAGAAATNTSWRFPLPATDLALEPADLLAALNRENDGRAMQKIERHLVAELRTWRPDVVVIPHGTKGSSNEPFAAILEPIIARAVTAAADPAQYVELVSDAGLALDRHAARLEIGDIAIDRTFRYFQPLSKFLGRHQTATAEMLDDLKQPVSPSHRSFLSILRAARGERRILPAKRCLAKTDIRFGPIRLRRRGLSISWREFVFHVRIPCPASLYPFADIPEGYSELVACVSARGGGAYSAQSAQCWQWAFERK